MNGLLKLLNSHIFTIKNKSTRNSFLKYSKIELPPAVFNVSTSNFEPRNFRVKMSYLTFGKKFQEDNKKRREQCACTDADEGVKDHSKMIDLHKK